MLSSRRSSICSSVRTCARRRQFERERDAIEAGTDPGDEWCVRGREAEGGQNRLRAGDEELHRREISDGVAPGECGGVGHRERRHAVLTFARDQQRFATGREHPQRRRRAEQLFGERRAGIDQMLAVVEDEERGVGAEERRDGIDRVPARNVSQANRVHHRERDECRVRDGRQFDEPGAPRKHRGKVGCELQRQAGLATTADPRQCQQPLIGVQEQVVQRGERVVAPDQRYGGCR
jgi:hypothetical protein